MNKNLLQTKTVAVAKSREMLAAIERAARAQGAIVHREQRIATPALEASVDLLVILMGRRIVYEAEFSPDCLRWNRVKAAALKAELQNIFPNQRLARAAQKCADPLETSVKTAHLSILCLTVDEALQMLSVAHQDGNHVQACADHSRPSILQPPAPSGSRVRRQFPSTTPRRNRRNHHDDASHADH